MSTKVSSPSAPAAPTTQSSIEDWVENYPAVFNLQQQYAPQEVQQQIALMQQYALPYAQALKAAQDQLYPNETALTNEMTAKVREGMGGTMPDWAKESYMDTMRAQLGENAMSGAGADYMSRGLLDQQKNWQDYYTNLGLSISGKQPVYNAQPTQYSNYAGQFTPNSVMDYNSKNYGSYSNAYSSMYGANAQVTKSMNDMYGQLGGSAMGAMGTMAAFSSARYKKNITSWA